MLILVFRFHMYIGKQGLCCINAWCMNMLFVLVILCHTYCRQTVLYCPPEVSFAFRNTQVNCSLLANNRLMGNNLRTKAMVFGKTHGIRDTYYGDAFDVMRSYTFLDYVNSVYTNQKGISSISLMNISVRELTLECAWKQAQLTTYAT